MNKEKKFRYIFKDDNGKLYTEFFSLEDIERGDVENALMGFDHDGIKVEIIAKDDFTGLEDKKGKEVYEGDIIYCVKDRFGKGQHEYWSVEYEGSKFIVFNQHNSERDIEIDIVRGNDNPFFSPDGEKENELEIIGNITENPELLK